MGVELVPPEIAEEGDGSVLKGEEVAHPLPAQVAGELGSLARRERAGSPTPSGAPPPSLAREARGVAQSRPEQDRHLREWVAGASRSTSAGSTDSSAPVTVTLSRFAVFLLMCYSPPPHGNRTSGSRPQGTCGATSRSSARARAGAPGSFHAGTGRSGGARQASTTPLPRVTLEKNSTLGSGTEASFIIFRAASRTRAPSKTTTPASTAPAPRGEGSRLPGGPLAVAEVGLVEQLVVLEVGESQDAAEPVAARRSRQVVERVAGVGPERVHLAHEEDSAAGVVGRRGAHPPPSRSCGRDSPPLP